VAEPAPLPVRGLHDRAVASGRRHGRPVRPGSVEPPRPIAHGRTRSKAPGTAGSLPSRQL